LTKSFNGRGKGENSSAIRLVGKKGDFKKIRFTGEKKKEKKEVLARTAGWCKSREKGGEKKAISKNPPKGKEKGGVGVAPFWDVN